MIAHLNMILPKCIRFYTFQIAIFEGQLAMSGFNYLKAAEPLQLDILLLTTKSPEVLGTHFDWPQKDERLRQPWGHTIVLSLGVRVTLPPHIFSVQVKLWSMLHDGSVWASLKQNKRDLTLTLTLNILSPSIVFHSKI